VARDRGIDVGGALDSTLVFLNDPAAWSTNAGHRNTDKPLARLVFAGALAAAGVKDTKPSPALVAVAKILEADQKADGSWPVEEAGAVTFGPTLATALARSTLIAAGREPDHFAVAQIDRWLRTVEATSVHDAAGIVLGLGGELDVMSTKQRSACLEIIRAAEAPNGGWGYQPGGSPQVFETAVVMLALREMARDQRVAKSAYGEENLQRALSAGRRFLQGSQSADGSWPAGPGPGKPNLARQVSTTAWALLALVETQ
jgi:hypothetical protein